MKAYLTRQGYQVLACRSAAAAWEQFAPDPLVYALAIVDMKLSGMSGAEFIGKIQELYPAIAVLAISGYPASLEALRQSNPRITILEKPFTPHMLKDAVQACLPKTSGQSG
jgi:DNA-binding NtrC family response regulator